MIDYETEILDVREIYKESGYCFHIPIPKYLSVSDTMEKGSDSKLRLYENGIELTESHSHHEQIRKIGRGKFSHWYEVLYFSSSDNSDPGTNGKQYSIDFKVRVFLIGTCRLHLTLNPTLKNPTIYPEEKLVIYSFNKYYPHYTKEILQYLDILAGRVHLPDELLVDSGPPGPETYLQEMSSRLMSSDIVLIEISSMKKIPVEVQGSTFYLNLNKHYNRTKKKDSSLMSSEEICSDLRTLCERLRGKKILFFTHHATAKSLARNFLVDLISDECARLNHPVFRPHEYTRSEFERYIPDGNHYSQEGLVLIRNALLDQLKNM